MRKYVYLFIGSLLAFSFLGFLYGNSVSNMDDRHKDVLSNFISAKRIDAALDKDLLESKNFLLSNYDSMVESEEEFPRVCQFFRDPQNGMYNDSSSKLAIDQYCSSVEEKIRLIEEFKSKNAIFKNSLYYVHKLEMEALARGGDSFEDDLIDATLAHATISTTESRLLLEKMLHKKRYHSRSGGVLQTHAEKVLALKDEIEQLVSQILNSETSRNLETTRQLYFTNYARSQSTASLYRIFIFSFSVFFLAVTIYTVLRLWKAARALSFANENLENRVRIRTRELESSRELIVQQQQSLVSSAKMSALGEMAGGVAHEINTPLAVIYMRAEQIEDLLIEGEAKTEDLLRPLAIIQKTTERISKIVTGLRTFARDGACAPFEIVSMDKIIEDTLDLCQERFKSHGVLIEKDFAGLSSSRMEVRCRPLEVSQILLNLLNNSFDAISECGEKKVTIAVRRGDQYLDLSVTDSGEMPVAVREKVMTPFFTTKEIGKGTGLGLSISKGLAEGHRGRLFLDPQSKNTKFILQLPLGEAPAIAEVRKA